MLDIRPLNEELQKIAREELNEKTEEIEENLRKLKEWIEETPHLKARTDDQFLIAFLRVCRYDLEKTKEQLDIFYTLRTKIPELTTERDPLNPTLKAIAKQGFGIPLPQTETEGSARYILIRPGSLNPLLYAFKDVIKVAVMVNDIQIREDDNWVISGQVEVIDLANVTKDHLAQVEPFLIKKMTFLSQDAFPVKSQGIHYVNTPKGFEQVFGLFLSCMNDENKSKVHMHGSDMETLYKFVPRRLMPAEYGGSASTIKELIEEWEEKLRSYRQYFEEEEEQFGVDESKRLPNAFNPNLIFNLDEIVTKVENCSEK